MGRPSRQGCDPQATSHGWSPCRAFSPDGSACGLAAGALGLKFFRPRACPSRHHAISAFCQVRLRWRLRSVQRYFAAYASRVKDLDLAPAVTRPVGPRASRRRGARRCGAFDALTRGQLWNAELIAILGSKLERAASAAGKVRTMTTQPAWPGSSIRRAESCFEYGLRHHTVQLTSPEMAACCTVTSRSDGQRKVLYCRHVTTVRGTDSRRIR